MVCSCSSNTVSQFEYPLTAALWTAADRFSIAFEFVFWTSFANKCQCSLVTMLWAGWSGVWNLVEARDFFVLQNVTLAQMPTQPPIHWILGFFFPLGIKHLVPEDNHSPPSTAKVYYEQSYACTPPVCVRGVDRWGNLLPFCCKRVKSLWSPGVRNMLICPW